MRTSSWHWSSSSTTWRFSTSTMEMWLWRRSLTSRCANSTSFSTMIRLAARWSLHRRLTTCWTSYALEGVSWKPINVRFSECAQRRIRWRRTRRLPRRLALLVSVALVFKQLFFILYWIVIRLCCKHMYSKSFFSFSSVSKDCSLGSLFNSSWILGITSSSPSR